MTSSGIACEFSINRLLKGRGYAYLWTFTTADCVPVGVTAGMWSNLARDLRRTLGFVGVRCFELHPRGHGLHIHFVTYRRHEVNEVRHLSDLHGFGRINVRRIPALAAPYIAKYLQKASRSPELKGVRLWSCIGFKDGSKVKDIIIDSPLSREIKKISDEELFLIVGGEHYWMNIDKMPFLAKLVSADSLRLRNHYKFLIAYHRLHTSAFELFSSVSESGALVVSLRPRPVGGYFGKWLLLPSAAYSAAPRPAVDWERLAIQHEHVVEGSCGRFDVGEYEQKAAFAV